jgi:hypothetical protein
MSLKDKWFFEKFLPEAGSHERYVNIPIFHGKVVDDLGNGFFQLEVQSDDERVITRIMNVADMSSWAFVSTYEELLDAMSKWHEVLKSGAELDKTFAALRNMVDDV